MDFYERSEFDERLNYVRQLLHTIRPIIPYANADLEAVYRENEMQLNTLRKYIFPMITDLEQKRVQNTLLFIGIAEEEMEDTKEVLMNFLMPMEIGVKKEDISSCYRLGNKSPKSIIVRFKNGENARYVLRKKDVIKLHGVHVEQFLCAERRKIKRQAIELLGRKSVSVQNGVINISCPDGTVKEISTIFEFDELVKELASDV